jgi:deoxyribonuclease V
MIACLDVYYKTKGATAACVLFNDWADESDIKKIITHIKKVKPYEPGRFFKRELPCLLYTLNKINDPLDTIIIDGYVWLDEKGSPGLGAYLYEASGKSIPVIGVAKSRFKGAELAEKVFRGRSERPLYITSAGITQKVAADYIKRMHGPHRIPTLLKKVDQLCRT